MQYSSVYVTCPDRDTARTIARELLQLRLVACANMLPIESLYHWEGRVEEATEVVMFLKTRRDLVHFVVQAVEKLHPYEVPCVVAFDLGAGSDAYLRWVGEETASARPLEDRR